MNAPDLSPIWLTAKTRMVAEKRLRLWAVVAHLALSWFSFCLIAASVWAAFNDVDWRYNAANILLSVFVFGLTLILYGFRFEERAGQFRECYLKLQAIDRGSLADQQKLDKYHELLANYPNHSESDWDTVLFNSWIGNYQLTNSSGLISVTKPMIFRSLLRKASIVVLIVLVAVFPALIFVYA